MDWKKINAFRDTTCDECKGIIGKGEEAAWRKNDGDQYGRIVCVVCYDRYARNETISKSNTTQTNCNVVNTPTPLVAPSREETIAKAHAENMAANQELVMAIRQLTVAVNDRTRFLKQVDYECKELEAKP
jgi:hypothetical protein